MVRFFLAILLLSSLLKADILEDKIKNLVESDGYNTHKKLIERIFANRSEFVNDERVNTHKVLSKLKDNGLLKLFFNEPKELRLTFYSNASPILSTTIISNSLKSMGYLYFVTEESEYVPNRFKQTFVLETEHVLDPAIFIGELKKRGGEAYDIRRNSQTHWEYDIDISSGRISDATYLKPENSITTATGVNEYFFELDGGSFLEIKSKGGNDWHPFVVFFDSHLNIVEILNEESKSLYKNIPLKDGVRYVKISDFFTKSNIKNGFIVKLIQ